MHSSTFFLLTLIASNLSYGIATPLNKRQILGVPQCPADSGLLCCYEYFDTNHYEQCTYTAWLFQLLIDNSVPIGTSVATAGQAKACYDGLVCCTKIVSCLSVVKSFVSAHSNRTIVWFSKGWGMYLCDGPASWALRSFRGRFVVGAFPERIFAWQRRVCSGGPIVAHDQASHLFR